KEGTLLAVRNFATNQDETHFSILQVASVRPVHYALGESPTGYPGFVMEAARNIATDWSSQEERSEEDTTIIRCVALPTGMELVESRAGRSLNEDQAIPMIGSDARVLTTDATLEIINREISPTADFVFQAGRWLVDQGVPIYARSEDFIRLHFGVFGFTGAGKSNLLSTYLAALFGSSRERQHPVKVVVFDLMSEYTVLLLDELLSSQNACILATHEHAFPGPVVDFLSGSAVQERNALDCFLTSTLYPRPLERIREHFRPA